MKKKFKIILLFIILLCSGCNIKYKVNINKNNIIEDISIDSIKEIIDSNTFLSAVEVLFQGALYDVKKYDDGTIRTNYSWTNFNTYKDKSLLFMKLVDSNNLSIKENKVSFNLKYNESLNDLINLLGDIDNLEISLYIPYYVSKHNADKVSDNTYTWIIDNIEKDSVKINFDMSKGVDYRNKVLSVITIIILGIVATWIIIYFVKRNKEANEI